MNSLGGGASNASYLCNGVSNVFDRRRMLAKHATGSLILNKSEQGQFLTTILA